jgi:hypothetical protein
MDSERAMKSGRCNFMLAISGKSFKNCFHLLVTSKGNGLSQANPRVQINCMNDLAQNTIGAIHPQGSYNFAMDDRTDLFVI